MKDSTKGVRNQIERSQHREHSAPIYMTSSFVYESAEQAAAMFAGEESRYIYSRFSNPNTTELIQKICAMEGAEDGVATASGMAAIFNTLTAYLKSGDRVVGSNSLFGNTTYILKEILPSWGIETVLVDIHDQDGWTEAITTDTKMVMIETPSNPGLDLIDLEWMVSLCQDRGVILAVDNCFASPIIQKPLDYGADLSIHSATKWLDGQGRSMGGIVVGSTELIEPIYGFLRRTGASMSPFNAWLLSKSTETLDVRMERHCHNALLLAKYLSDHPAVQSVRYPFLESHPQYDLAKKQMTMGGGIVTCVLRGGQESCFRAINRTQLMSITANLGDSRTIITHPTTTTHSKLSEADRQKAGIMPGTLRISVGLEHIDDIIADFDQALS